MRVSTRPDEAYLREYARLAERLAALYASLAVNEGTSERILLLLEVEHEIQRFLFRFREVLPGDIRRGLLTSMAQLREAAAMASALVEIENRSRPSHRCSS